MMYSALLLTERQSGGKKFDFKAKFRFCLDIPMSVDLFASYFALLASQGNIRHFPVTHLQAGCFAIQNRSRRCLCLPISLTTLRHPSVLACGSSALLTLSGVWLKLPSVRTNHDPDKPPLLVSTNEDLKSSQPSRLLPLKIHCILWIKWTPV